MIQLPAVPGRRRLVDGMLVAFGGYLGANGRYFVALSVSGTLEATLLVNVVGSFLLGLLVYWGVYRGMSSESIPSRISLLFGTGALSSFTTYSTFALDAATHTGAAIPYIIASYLFGFAAVLGGRRMIEFWQVLTGDAQ